MFNFKKPAKKHAKVRIISETLALLCLFNINPDEVYT